jgi:tripeptidyl-peptidase-1
MHFFTLSILGALVAQAAAAPQPANHVLRELRDATPKSWVKRDRLDAAVQLSVCIGMT